MNMKTEMSKTQNNLIAANLSQPRSNSNSSFAWRLTR